MSKTSPEPVYEILREQIISGEFAPGTALRQDEIAKIHGMSKIPIREALLKLEVDGFVTFRKNHGATVRELSTDEILNLIDIRTALECHALELAVPNMIESDFETAKQILDEYTSEGHEAKWSDLNMRFHRTLFEPCGNPMLLRLIMDVLQRIGPQLRAFVTQTSGFQRPHSEHLDILTACQKGDMAKAVMLMRDHIETTRKEVAARLRRRANGEEIRSAASN